MANEINVFECSCGAEEMEKEAFQKHLEEKHGIKPDQIKGTKQSIMHIDFTNSYVNSYQWKLESGFEFKQHIEGMRSKSRH